ncbi:filamentous hemagglutinin N-terminal domain-containing protein [Leptolyngbyaceae cyanobacterium CCMR0082]|uniref:Filamentous hemagglutinin N-terminal domain-containing protein n=1 Tax=Adonisia turfae CCMR0082 TaxID=2304604 RepID=A0A6M0S129_9CYAN|nr:filamentous hemagglutinin N-terminal domain-containing protein [Adonisia turfae]NEZ61813.1 filamentous hemagglutinin N-terminal domain-containing protein [Adonisia turfae CCMR0082]
MFSKKSVFGVWVFIKIIGCHLLSPEVVWSQVIPDGTTPTPNPGSCLPSCTIEGGTSTPTNPNLFHSFEQFSVPTNGIVIFEHGPTIRNIVARVTGKNSSDIDGLIRTSSLNNNANLFLINPNGISFGPRGGLDIGGSFIATTANVIQFGEQGLFSTADTDSELALLTVDPTAFLFTQDTPQPIVNQSIAPNPDLPFLVDGLRVEEGRSLILLGGNITFERAPNSLNIDLPIRAPGGRIELGGVRNSSIVSLDINDDALSLSYADNTILADITINDTDIDVSGLSNNRAGDITITANSLSLNSSGLLSDSFGTENAGNISIRTNNFVTIQDGSLVSSTSFDSGTGGNIEVIAEDISLDNGSLSVTARGMGDAGRILLDAETISLNAESSIRSDVDSFAEMVGNVGEIRIRTNIFSLSGESRVSILTSGEAMSLEASSTVNIEAKDSISLVDRSSITSETRGRANASNIEISTPELVIDNSAISASVNEEGDDFSDATGQGGTIEIETQVVSLLNSAQITSNTSGDGDAGAISIRDAESVSLSNSIISTETSALGNGGDIDITTQQLTASAGANISAAATNTAAASAQSGNFTLNINQIDLSGQETGLFAATQGAAAAGLIALNSANAGEALTINFQEGAQISAATSGSGDGGRVVALVPEGITLTGNGSLSTRSTGAGPAGDIDIQTNGQFRVQNGAEVEVSGEGTGNSGMLDVIAETVVLNDGKLLASVQAGEDGNINLEIEDALILRGDSLISAEAFNTANGGNVNITTPFIIALSPDGPNGNDIQAIARQGNGGRIAIQANTLFGIEENKATLGNRTNDIDASSEAGIDGEVIIDTLQVDPDEGIDPLPSSLAAPEISQGCQTGSNGQFIATGQGGLPSNPYEPLSSDGIQEDIYPAGQTLPQPVSTQQTDTTETLIEAQGWNRDEQGNIVLLATTPDTHSSCQVTLNGAF